MDTIRITKEFHFEMAHALKGYDGPCRNVHGHSYQMLVTIKGTPILDEKSPKLGMVMDFGDLKDIVNKLIVDEFDHAFVVNGTLKKELIDTIKSNFEKVVVLDYQPTSELMVIDFANRIKKVLPNHLKLHSVLLRETGTSYAEWFAEDN